MIYSPQNGKKKQWNDAFLSQLQALIFSRDGPMYKTQHYLSLIPK